jgi:hypothetical protein
MQLASQPLAVPEAHWPQRLQRVAMAAAALVS